MELTNNQSINVVTSSMIITPSLTEYANDNETELETTSKSSHLRKQLNQAHTNKMAVRFSDSPSSIIPLSNWYDSNESNSPPGSTNSTDSTSSSRPISSSSSTSSCGSTTSGYNSDANNCTQNLPNKKSSESNETFCLSTMIIQRRNNHHQHNSIMSDLTSAANKRASLSVTDL
jgi:hypothetical protein